MMIEIFKRLRTGTYLIKITDQDDRGLPTSSYSSIEWPSLEEARSHGNLLKESYNYYPKIEYTEFVETI